MKKSNYAQFLETFTRYFETDYENNNHELANSEILEFAYKRFKEENLFWFFLLIAILIVVTISLLLIYPLRIALFTMILPGYAIAIYGFFRTPRFYVFNRKNLIRLRMRLNYLKARHMNDVNYSKEETLRLLKATSPEVCEKEIVAERIYCKLKESSLDNQEEKNDTLKNSAKLYLLYILLNRNFKISTTDEEFGYIVAAITGIKHRSLMSTELTKLNLLYKYLNSEKKELPEKKKKELLEILESVNRYMLNTKDVQELMNQVRLDLSPEQKKSPS